MAVTPTPIFAQAVRSNTEAISTANTNRDGTGTLGSSPFTAGSNGSVVERVTIEATGTTTAGVVRLYKHNGTTAFLWLEVLISAVTPSTTVSAFRRLIERKCYLPSGWSLRASTHNAETFNIHSEGYDF